MLFRSLATIDLSPLNTTNLNSMRNMFYGCTALKTVDFSKFTVSRVNNMEGVFYQCSLLETVTYPRTFTTTGVTTMKSMYAECFALRSLDLSPFNTSNTTDMSRMFYKCRSLNYLNISNFNVQKVTNMSYMFQECLSLSTIDVSSFNAPALTTMTYMFYNCQSLNNLVLPLNMNTTSLTDISYAFAACYAMTHFDMRPFVVNKVTTMRNLFTDDRGAIEIDLSSWVLNTDSTVYAYYMFNNCANLTTVYVSEKWNYTRLSATGGYGLFLNCRKLVGANGVKWNADRAYQWARYDHASQGYFSAKATKGTVQWTMNGAGELVAISAPAASLAKKSCRVKSTFS